MIDLLAIVKLSVDLSVPDKQYDHGYALAQIGSEDVRGYSIPSFTIPVTVGVWVSVVAIKYYHDTPHTDFDPQESDSEGHGEGGLLPTDPQFVPGEGAVSLPADPQFVPGSQLKPKPPPASDLKLSQENSYVRFRVVRYGPLFRLDVRA